MSRDFVAVAAVVVVAAVSVAPGWRGPVDWTPDGYFYEAQVLEARGATAETARAIVFRGPLTADRRASERATLHPRDRRVASPRWVRYSAPFFRRRWTVPLAAAAVYPLFGDRSLEIVSLTGYIVAAAALYLLARQRFTPAVSAGAAVLASLLPQYRATALSPLTDTWGIALEALCLVLAIRFCDTGRRPLVVGWLFAMLLLAFTRDDAAVVALALLIAGVWSRRALLLGAVGSAAAVVPSLWFGTHYPRLLAYTLADSHIPPATGLTWSLHHYWGGVETLARGLATPIRFGIPPVTGLALLVGLAGLLLAPRGLFRRLAATTAVAAVVFMLSLPQSGYRIALVLLPSATAGYAALGAAGVRWRREDRGVRVQ